MPAIESEKKAHMALTSYGRVELSINSESSVSSRAVERR